MLKFAVLPVAVSLFWLQAGDAPPEADMMNAVATPAEASPPVVAPVPDHGAELTQARCISCHESARFTRQRLTAEQWHATVERMIGHGARVTPEEAPEIVAYLARAHGPEAAEPAAVQ